MPNDFDVFKSSVIEKGLDRNVNYRDLCKAAMTTEGKSDADGSTGAIPVNAKTLNEVLAERKQRRSLYNNI